MRDFSINIPSWAIREGYRLKGGMGTYDDLYLYRHGDLVRWWEYPKSPPNIFELEGIIATHKDQETPSPGYITHKGNAG